jgi:hypothetical protein
MPVVRHGGARLDKSICLKPHVVEPDKQAGNKRVDDEDHHALEVDAVSHVDGPFRPGFGGKEEGIDGVVKRVERGKRFAGHEELIADEFNCFA